MGALRVEDAYPRYTYGDYVHWEGRWELINGIAFAMSPAPLLKHQSITSKINYQLYDLFKDCEACEVFQPVDWKIGEDTVVQPDNLVICHKQKNEKYLVKPPVIIFEVLSKSTEKKDRLIKFDLYESEGVKYYFIVDPNEEVVKAYELKDGRYIKFGDFSDEKIRLEIEKCKKNLEFDFSKIW